MQKPLSWVQWKTTLSYIDFMVPINILDRDIIFGIINIANYSGIN